MARLLDVSTVSGLIEITFEFNPSLRGTPLKECDSISFPPYLVDKNGKTHKEITGATNIAPWKWIKRYEPMV